MPAEGVHAQGDGRGGRPLGGRQQGLRRAARARRRVAARRSRRGRRGRRSQRLRQVHAPRARLRAADARCRHDPSRARRPHAPARQPAPLGGGARQRRAATAPEGAEPRDGARGRARDVRHLRPRRLRGRTAPRALRRDAPAGRVPAHAAGGQAGAVPRRAVRLAGRAHAPGAADLARRRSADGAAHRAARDARRRGGARAGRSRPRPLAPPGNRARDARGRAAAPAVAHRSGRRRPARARARGARRVTAALLVLVFLGGWELYARSGAVDDLILPAPTQIADAIGHDHRLLWDNFLVTASEVAVGLLAALVLGFGRAVTLHFSRTARRAVYPLLVGSQALPVVVIAPLLLVWLGFGLGAKVGIIGLVSFFPIVVTTLDALRAFDADLLKLLRTMDATRWQAFRFAELPAAAPAALSGAKIAVAVSVIGAVFAEYAGSESGLGHLILQAIPQLQTARAYAAVVILAALAVVLFYLLSAAERWLNPRTGGTPS